MQQNVYLVGDCRELMRGLPDGSIDCVVTSPPYWGLRDYGIDPSIWGGRTDCEHRWGDELTRHKGGPHGAGVALDGRSVVKAKSSCKDVPSGQFCQDCGAWRGCLGLEPDYRLYVDHMVEVFGEVKRVLRDEGTLWLNLGDCYATGAGAVGSCPGGGAQGEKWRGSRGKSLANGRGDCGPEGHTKAIGPMTQPNRLPQPGLKPKDLVGIPWRVAFALQDDGWYLRSEIIWHKPNPMPESVTDRPTKAHEQLFLLTKAERYFYDADAIKEPASCNTHPRWSGVSPKSSAPRGENLGVKQNAFFASATSANVVSHRNKRSVWTIPTEPMPEAHFAIMPTKLVQPCILAGCPEGGLVLDPFGGSGTVGKVAEELGRKWVLFDVSREYAGIAKRRTAQVGLF